MPQPKARPWQQNRPQVFYLRKCEYYCERMVQQRSTAVSSRETGLPLCGMAAWQPLFNESRALCCSALGMPWASPPCRRTSGKANRRGACGQGRARLSVAWPVRGPVCPSKPLSGHTGQLGRVLSWCWFAGSVIGEVGEGGGFVNPRLAIARARAPRRPGVFSDRARGALGQSTSASSEY